jgi:hypothetical protein
VTDRRTPDATLISALRILARDIQSGDGCANACLLETATRLEELVDERRWVPVGERVPQNEELVDIAGECGELIGYYSVKRWMVVDFNPVWGAITHWRERTPGPEGDGNG